jgi:calcineurin-like phosphoesterase family protein
MVFRNVLLTHEPANAIIVKDGHLPYKSLNETGLPLDCTLNVHGHLHNIWDGFSSQERMERDKELLGVDYGRRLKHPWQRLFAVEYTNYMPVNFDKFISQPDKYQSRGPKPKKFSEVRDQLVLPAEGDYNG